jgi:hypothetical protein
MSSAFRRAGAKKPTEQPQPIGLVPLSKVVLPRRPYGFKEAIIGPQGRVITPIGEFSQVTGNVPLVDTRAEVHVPLGEGEANDEIDTAADKRTAKTQRQWRRWSEDVIPALLQPYMELLDKTSGLRDMQGVRARQGCSGCASGRLLNVSCIFFERMYFLYLDMKLVN